MSWSHEKNLSAKWDHHKKIHKNLKKERHLYLKNWRNFIIPFKNVFKRFWLCYIVDEDANISFYVHYIIKSAMIFISCYIQCIQFNEIIINVAFGLPSDQPKMQNNIVLKSCLFSFWCIYDILPTLTSVAS